MLPAMNQNIPNRKHITVYKKMEKDLIPIDIYKDPLKKNEEGFGYLGCLLQTREEDKLQCHICGELHAHLSLHIAKHNIKVKEYRKKFNLCYNTKLTSRTSRMEYSKRFLSLPKEKREEWRKKGMLGLKKYHEEGKGKDIPRVRSLEWRNKLASCPDQILEELKKFSEEIGKVPSIRDFTVLHPTKTRYTNLAVKTFGSWGKALEKAGLKMNKGGRFKNTKVKIWDTQDLIEMLQIFTKENNRLPRSMDCDNGELPARAIFTRRFGGMEKARQEANLQDILI